MCGLLEEHSLSEAAQAKLKGKIPLRSTLRTHGYSFQKKTNRNEKMQPSGLIGGNRIGNFLQYEAELFNKGAALRGQSKTEHSLNETTRLVAGALSFCRLFGWVRPAPHGAWHFAGVPCSKSTL